MSVTSATNSTTPTQPITNLPATTTPPATTPPQTPQNDEDSLHTACILPGIGIILGFGTFLICLALLISRTAQMGFLRYKAQPLKKQKNSTAGTIPDLAPFTTSLTPPSNEQVERLKKLWEEAILKKVAQAKQDAKDEDAKKAELEKQKKDEEDKLDKDFQAQLLQIQQLKFDPPTTQKVTKVVPKPKKAVPAPVPPPQSAIASEVDDDSTPSSTPVKKPKRSDDDSDREARDAANNKVMQHTISSKKVTFKQTEVAGLDDDPIGAQKKSEKPKGQKAEFLQSKKPLKKYGSLRQKDAANIKLSREEALKRKAEKLAALAQQALAPSTAGPKKPTKHSRTHSYTIVTVQQGNTKVLSQGKNGSTAGAGSESSSSESEKESEENNVSPVASPKGRGSPIMPDNYDPDFTESEDWSNSDVQEIEIDEPIDPQVIEKQKDDFLANQKAKIDDLKAKKDKEKAVVAEKFKYIPKQLPIPNAECEECQKAYEVAVKKFEQDMDEYKRKLKEEQDKYKSLQDEHEKLKAKQITDLSSVNEQLRTMREEDDKCKKDAKHYLKFMLYSVLWLFPVVGSATILGAKRILNKPAKT